MPSSFESSVRAASVGFALAALSTATAVHAQPAPRVMYVDASAPEGGTGALWTSAFRNLQDALFTATLRPDRTVPVQIKIAQGIYTPSIGTLSRDARFVVNSAVSLLGGFAGLQGQNPSDNDPSRFVTVLSGDLARNDTPGISSRGDNSDLVLEVQSQPGTIDGLTISGGARALYRVGFGPLNISRCTIQDCILTENYASGIRYDAAIVDLYEATLVDCTIADLSSFVAPCLATRLTSMQRCKLVGNRYVYLSGAYPAGLVWLSSDTIFDSCLIAANSSSSSGLILLGDSIAFYNTTLADNIAARGPAGHYNFGASSTSATYTNCVLARNISTDSNVPQHQLAGGHVTLDSCLLQRGTADLWNNGGFSVTTRIATGDPGFVNPAGPDGDAYSWRDNNYRLAPSSQCIDRGTTSPILYLSPHRDILGQLPIDAPSSPNLGVGSISYLDLGCYEYVASFCSADFDHSGALSPFDIFAFLNAWFALSPTADFNASGTITPQDIFDFLGAWFAGC